MTLGFSAVFFGLQKKSLTGYSRDETQGPQHSEGSQCLHVEPPTLLHWHTCYLINGIQGKGEETVGKDYTTISAYPYKTVALIENDQCKMGIQQSNIPVLILLEHITFSTIKMEVSMAVSQCGHLLVEISTCSSELILPHEDDDKVQYVPTVP